LVFFETILLIFDTFYKKILGSLSFDLKKQKVSQKTFVGEYRMIS